MKLKFNKKFLYLLPLLLVVVVSGCTTGGGGTDSSCATGSGEGLVISQFCVKPANLYVGDSATVTMKLLNSGKQAAENVQLRLETTREVLNLPQTVSLPGGLQTIPPVEAGEQALPIDILPIQAQVLKSPAPGTATPVPLKVAAYLFYKYKTTATKNFDVISSSELKRINEGGEGTLSGTPIQIGGEGPVSIRIDSVDVVRVPDTQSRTLVINLFFQNQGPGVVSGCTSGGSCVDDFTARITNLEVLGNNLGECKGRPSQVRIDKEGTSIPCVLDLPPSSGAFASQGFITGTVEYSYRHNLETSVTVSDVRR